MKRVLVGTLTAIMVLSIGTIGAFAVSQGSGYGRNFVDVDGNDVCDFAGEFCRYVDADLNGVCDNRDINPNGCGSNFADTNDDGVCDDYLDQGMCRSRGFRGGQNR